MALRNKGFQGPLLKSKVLSASEGVFASLASGIDGNQGQQES